MPARLRARERTLTRGPADHTLRELTEADAPSPGPAADDPDALGTRDGRRTEHLY
ncbi:hypothetical protein [Geodermatophilus sp. TF02-6]|uniref:hypothetical protein n=1 Tax=Geodermatophilus sp. TF02-6 TaxID=2250575 RepID=UPI001314DA11|nr:hypothetical protein [Geodermatophilus sp. TF02-6]